MADTTALQAALPDYEVATELGRGAMGIVYLATHRALGRTVAIKELPESFAVDDTVRQRFLSEARVVASLDHPHVVVIYDFVDRDDHLALVMEHLPNGTVWDQFVHHGLAAPRACGLTLATLAGVHHAHERGVMHRDIKPENLIFNAEWQLKVTDFGIAQVLTGDETFGTEEGAIVGTPAYMSPEQAEGRSCGPPADVYASGAMLYEMLTGALPFPDGESAMAMAMARLARDPVPIRDVGPAVPEAIAEVTMHALQRSEADRFQSAEEFGVALAQAAAFTWGPDWMTESGTAVTGSRAIEVAARTTDRRSFSQAGTVADATSPTVSEAPPASDQSALTLPEPGSVPEAAETVAEEPRVDGPPPPLADERGTGDGDFFPGDVDATAAPPTAAAPPPVYEDVPTAPVLPLQREHPRGADLNQLGPADIINLREVRAPGSPVVFAVAAVMVLLLAAGAALLGRGDDPLAVEADGILVDGRPLVGDVPIEVDLTEPFAFEGPVEELSATFLGIPIGVPTLEEGELDPSYLRYSGAGVIEFSGETPDGREVRFAVRATNSPFPTAPFVAAAMLTLGGLASVNSNLRGLRARRFRMGPYVGLLASGAIAGGAAAVLGMVLLETPTARAAVITAALLGAAGSALLGEAYRRWYRRRRLRRVAIARSRR